MPFLLGIFKVSTAMFLALTTDTSTKMTARWNEAIHPGVLRRAFETYRKDSSISASPSCRASTMPTRRSMRMMTESITEIY